jgi:hypothetical protein
MTTPAANLPTPVTAAATLNVAAITATTAVTVTSTRAACTTLKLVPLLLLYCSYS